jgi:hypothetical protein
MGKTSIEWLHYLSRQRELDVFDWEMAKEIEKEQLCKMYVQGRNDNHLDYYPIKHAKETYNEFFNQNETPNQ